jgi:hypothetical protein
MTTTYNAPSYTNKSPVVTEGLARNLLSFRDVVTTTAALGLNDGGTFGYLPPNAVVVGGYAKFATAMDTASATLTIDIGVTGAAQTFLAADTTARAGGTVSTIGKGYKNTSGAKIAITWLAHAAATTGAAGTIELHLSYIVEEPTTSG